MYQSIQISKPCFLIGWPFQTGLIFSHLYNTIRKADFQSLLIFIYYCRQSFYLFFRTDTLLEIFEDAPDDNANWGEVVDTEKKFYNTSTSEGSSSSSDENGKKENNLDVKPVRSLTLRWFSVTRFDYTRA